MNMRSTLALLGLSLIAPLGCAAAADSAPVPMGGAGDKSGGSTSTGTTGAGTGGSSNETGSGGSSPYFPSIGSGGTSTPAGNDAAAPSASSEAGSTTACSASLGLCDDFEGTAPAAQGSSWLIDKDKLATVVEVSTDKAHSGTHSIHVHVAEATADSAVYGYITETKTFPADQNTFWGRMWVWSETGSQPSHVVNIEADGTYTGGKTEGVRIMNTMGDKIASNLESTDASQVSATVLPQGKWSCYEWQMLATGLHLYLDGAEITKAAATWPAPNVTKLRIGFQRWSKGPAADTWIDDVAVNAMRIGCN